MWTKKISNFVANYQEAICVLLVLLFIVLTSLLLNGCSIFGGKPVIPVKPILPETKIIEIYKIDWMMSLSILTIGAGAFVFFMGNKSGIRIMAAAMIVVISLLTITKYALYFSIIGLVGAVALIVYTTYTSRKDHSILNTALQQIIGGIEKFKTNGISGDVLNLLKTTLKDAQSPTTEKIVETVKKNGNNNKTETK